MISSPPEEAEQIRGKTLTPESPKPQYYPSPSNIPILEMQMDPLLNEPALSIGTPASFQYPQQTQTPSAHSSTSYYAEPQTAHHAQNAPATGPAGAGVAGFSHLSAFNGGLGGQAQHTPSNHNLSAQEQPASAHHDTALASAQEARPAYPFAFDASAYPSQQSQAQSGASDSFLPPIDVQALLDKLSTPGNPGLTSQFSAPPAPPQSAQSQAPPAASSLPAAPNLPPRPPPQAKPATHPNYNPNDDIRSYHPHSGHRGSTQLQPVNVRGSTDESAKRSNVSPTTPSYAPRQSLDAGRSTTPDDDHEDSRWPPHVNKQYEDFLDQERRYVTEGQWDQFPNGSRLFIGNLPTEKVTKRDIFHRFYRHGQLAQISIKQAYGFVQFLYAESCSRALQAEQGQQVRGRKMHLEVSKPQRNTKKADPEKNNAPRRRSRSPDYGRGGSGPAPRGEFGRNQNAMSPRDRDRRFRERDRDEFRPMRSPSPRDGRGYRARDRSRDRYDQRRRSRSRSPRRYRSPSPRAGDGLPLPPRPPHRVPEVQILAQESLPKDFVQWVEDAFQDGGLRVNVLRMSPRLDEGLVEQRQILEGVLVIVRLDTAALASGKISLQVFDRRAGVDNVRFDTYANLDLPTAVALVNQAKQKNNQPVQQALPTPFGQGFGAPPGVAPYNMPASAGTANPANLSSLLTALSPDQLAQLLAAMPRNSPAQTPQPQPAGLTPELARLLSAVSTPAPAPTYNMQAPPPQSYANPYQNPPFAPQYGGQLPMQQQPAQPVQPPPNPPTPGQADINEIMVQLAKYQR